MSRWVVHATHNGSGTWTLEQPELGAVSEVADLDDSCDEMVEAIAHRSGEPAAQVEIVVEEVHEHRLGIDSQGDREQIGLALVYTGALESLTDLRWPGPEGCEANRLDVLVGSKLSVTHTLVTSQRTARACALFLDLLLRNDMQPRASIAVVLCRAALVSAARIIYVLGPREPEERLRRAHQITRRQTGSWLSALDAFSDFEHLSLLVPPDTLADEVRAHRVEMPAGEVGDGALILASAQTMAEQLERRGIIPEGEHDVVREHLTWMWHVWSGEAHGWAWVDAVPGGGDPSKKRPPGHWPSDFLMLTRVVHLALLLLNEALRPPEDLEQ